MHNDRPLCVVPATARVAPNAIMRGRGRVLLGEYVSIEDHVLMDTGQALDSTIEIGARSKVKYGAVLRTYDGAIRIGRRTSIGEYTVIAGHGGVEIGEAVIIAAHCSLSASEHIFSGDGAVRFQGETATGIRVCDGAWVGAGCAILDGVRIEEYAVIGAGSVVTRSLPADAICVGAPCRVVRSSRRDKFDHNW